MQHKCKVTVLDKKVYPELQSRYCADPGSGACPCYNAGDEYVFERYGSRDDFWHMGAGTLVKGGSPGSAGSEGIPHCSEAWDAISRYIYTALQGGAIMRGWMADERVMITCCSDGTRPVIFKLERLDYKAVYLSGGDDSAAVHAALGGVEGVTGVAWREEGFYEVYVYPDASDADIRAAAAALGYETERID